jgi:hypothetical protein
MTIDLLQDALKDQDSFKRMFRKEETANLLNGLFTVGRAPYIHQVVFEDGSQLRLKFYDTIKVILNSKGQPVFGKESFLSYIEISVLPAGGKGYSYTVDPKQIVWGISKTKAQEKHDQALQLLKDQASAFGIDLSAPTSWATVYTENY